MLLLRLLRPLLVLLMILMMLLITLMMFSDSLVFFWRAGLFGLFVSTCLFCPWAVEAETMDTSGAVGCAFGNVCELAAQLETEVSKDQAV